MEAVNRNFRIIASGEAKEARTCGAEMMSAVMEQPVVAASGEFREVEAVRLYRSTQPGVLLFAPTRLALERSGRNGRYQASLTQFRHWHEGVWRYAGGSALLIVTSAVHPEPDFNHHFADRWRSALFEQGWTGSVEPVFVPLPRRKQRLEVILDPESGRSSCFGAGGIHGETTSLVIELTSRGAQQWGSAIREKVPFEGRVRWTYEYPQMLPEAEVCFTVNGTRVSTHPQFEAGDLSLKLIFQARTWVETTIETDFSMLLAPLDESYLNVVPVEAAETFQVVVRTGHKNGDQV
ncbi:MAG TPA: hypothetical protein VNQ79_02445 [Blastocatellia bacterium]|nr:hypothetical protein [Blastocatellia bacterium]